MKHLLLLTCALLLIFTGCQKQTFGQFATTQVTLEKEATLEWQDCAYFVKQDLTVCFVDVKENRCPCGAQCLTAGSVDVTLHLISITAGIDTTVVLTSNSDTVDFIGQTTVRSKKIWFTRIITPTPDTCEGYGEAEKYKIKIAVE